jgi:transketolase
MSTDSRIFLITADLGYGILDDIRRDFPDRAVNVGSCEQLMIGTAVGLANSGFVPVCYSITPFLLYRPFEMIRNYVNYEKLNIKLVGSGRDKDYSHDGITHWGDDDLMIMKCLSNISLLKPKELSAEVFKNFISTSKPTYLNLSRF